MPDTWTTNPQKLKGMLSATGWECGIAPRIYRDRDPEWTCGYNAPTGYGDIYIHHAGEFATNPTVIGLMAMTFLFGLVAGYFSAKKIFTAPPQ